LIVLDTDALIEILEKRSARGEVAYSAVIGTGEPICTSSINLHELLYRLKKYGKSLKEALTLPVVDYTKNDALLSSDIENQLSRSGKVVRRTDTMIAAVAINASAQLLTLNLKHFEPITKVSRLVLFDLSRKQAQ
jgi:tRNA(fMet)-specific endonuclease VapC